jgi:hypothetical protein
MQKEETIGELVKRIKNLTHEEHQKRIERLVKAYAKRKKERDL